MRRLAALAVGLLLAAGAPLTVAQPAAATSMPVAVMRPMAAAGTNLLLNPGAETGLCTASGYDAMTVPGWTVTAGSPDSVCYGAVGFPRIGTPGPATGRAFFSGGATGNANLTQRISLAPAHVRVDAGLVTYRLGGWLGGWAAQNDRVGLTATFTGSHNAVLGQAGIEPVTNTDRAGTTGFVRRGTTGTIPPGTRAVVVTLAFTWTAGDTTDAYADDVSFTVSTPVPIARLAVPASEVPSFDHVFFVFMENENSAKNEAPADDGDYIVDNPAAPYINSVLTYGSARLGQMFATTHPSDPNYLAVTGGSTFGWTTNPIVGKDRIDAANLGDELEAVGKSWTAYAEGAFGNCDMTSHNTAAGGYYLPDDEPFMLYADIVGDPDRCAAHNQPLSHLGDDLASAARTPSFVWLAANDVNSMEGGGVAAGDAWLARALPQIYASPAWTAARSLLIVSWDEGHRKAFGPDYPNHIATYIAASQGLVKDDYVSTVRYTDYSLAATIEAALGLGPLTSNDAYAQPVNDIWTTSGTSGGAPLGSETTFHPTPVHPTPVHPTPVHPTPVHPTHTLPPRPLPSRPLPPRLLLSR
jgi:hypothetical protein